LLLQRAPALAAAPSSFASATRQKLFHLAFQVGWHLNEVITKVAARKSKSQQLYMHNTEQRSSVHKRENIALSTGALKFFI